MSDSQVYDKEVISNVVNFEKLRIAYSGTHGTGKTTSVFDMAKFCKYRFPNRSVHVITETASESPFKINKLTTEQSQLWIFSTQIKNELDCHKYNVLISDRTIVDCIAYSKYARFDTLVNAQLDLAKVYISNYDYIFFKSITKNNYLFKDGIRDETDLDFRKYINDYLLSIYDELKKYTKHPDVIKYI